MPGQREKWGPLLAPLQTAAALSEETPAFSGPPFCHLQNSMGGIPRSVQTNAGPWPQPVSKPKVLIRFDSMDCGRVPDAHPDHGPHPWHMDDSLPSPRWAMRPVLAYEGDQVKVSRRDHFPGKGV